MDYDGDGDLDILSGSYTGEVYLFVRGEDGRFAQGVFLENHDGGPLQTGTSITPEAHDLDGDGDLDLLIGTRSDGVFVHENLGTRTAPSIAATGTPLKTADGTKIHGSNAHYADWDHDGVRDLVLGGEWGGVTWHKNLGSDTKPRFAEAKTLLKNRRSNSNRPAVGETPTGPGNRTKVHVADWNDDGRVDLLVGDVTWHRLAIQLTKTQLREKARLKPRYDEALQTYLAASRARARFLSSRKPVPDDVTRKYEKARTHYQSLSKQMGRYRQEKSETHGYVWLHLRGGEPRPSVATVRSQKASDSSLSVQAEARPSGDRFDVTIRLSIDAGWHTYASAPEGSGYRLTTASLTLPEGFEQVGELKTKGHRLPATDGSGATWFVGEVEFWARVRRQPGATGKLTATVSTQACNHELCMPPTKLAVTLPLGSAND